jgi:hypothetical protein
MEMSLASYIGCNIEIPLSGEDSNDIILIGDSFSEEQHRINVKKHQFTTTYVYEVSTDWGLKFRNSRIQVYVLNQSKSLLDYVKLWMNILNKVIISNCIAVGSEKKQKSEKLI